MNIAFISYEYPPDTAYGGIATYVHQAAMMLSRRGHHVEVFSGSPHRTGTENEECLLVHRINVKINLTLLNQSDNSSLNGIK